MTSARGGTSPVTTASVAISAAVPLATRAAAGFCTSMLVLDTTDQRSVYLWTFELDARRHLVNMA
jgi:hypothetical protein